MVNFEDAACTEDDTDIFFPEGTDVKGKTALAKAICASCPIAAACLQYALATNEEFGIWGGTTPEERKRGRRRTILVGK